MDDKELTSNGLLDLSNLNISSHALLQYNVRCCPFLDITKVIILMRGHLNALTKIDLKKTKKKYKHTNYYIDDEEIIYVVVGNTIVTTYPKEKIFNIHQYSGKCGLNSI